MRFFLAQGLNIFLLFFNNFFLGTAHCLVWKLIEKMYTECQRFE